MRIDVLFFLLSISTGWCGDSSFDANLTHLSPFATLFQLLILHMFACSSSHMANFFTFWPRNHKKEWINVWSCGPICRSHPALVEQIVEKSRTLINLMKIITHLIKLCSFKESYQNSKCGFGNGTSACKSCKFVVPLAMTNTEEFDWWFTLMFN